MMTLSMRRGRFDPLVGLAGFDDLFDQMSRMLTSAFPDVARISVNAWAPPVDVQETDEDFRVEADMPGVSADDVTVDLQRNELRIAGQYGAEPGGGERAEGGGRQRMSSRRGRFDYRVTLPGEVNTERCSAELDNGVLRLRLPKASGGRRRIQVQAGSGQRAQAIEGESRSGSTGGAGTSG